MRVARHGLPLFAVLAGALAASPAAAQIPNLAGQWRAPFTVENHGKREMQMEDLVIVQHGRHVEATKRTGDAYVPAGKMNLRADVSASHFAALQLCAAFGFSWPGWSPVTITILDKDHFRVDGGCSGGAVWTRQAPATT